MGAPSSTVTPITEVNGATMNGAMYFKNPSPEMLERPNNNRFVGGVLFIETSDPNGKFTVPKSITATSVLSGSKIDFSVADFIHPVTTIRAYGTVLSDLKV